MYMLLTPEGQTSCDWGIFQKKKKKMMMTMMMMKRRKRGKKEGEAG